MNQFCHHLMHKLVLARQGKPEQGYALPIALGLGIVMLTVGMTSILVSQNGLSAASQRKQTNTSFFTSEGGIARTLATLITPTNNALATRNYDTINPKTGTTFLGPDGVPNSGDEEATAIDEWTSYSPSGSCEAGSTPNISLSGTIGQNGQYTIKAYRYNSSEQTGTILVEGRQGGAISYVAITLAVETGPSMPFPGVVTTGGLALQGRPVWSDNSNVYYNPATSADSSLTDLSRPGDRSRPQYLSALSTGPTDNIGGTIIACELTPTVDTIPHDIDQHLGAIDLDEDDEDLVLQGSAGKITTFRASEIRLESTRQIMADVRDGPIHIYVDGPVTLSDTSRIRNIVPKGAIPQAGNLRIIMTSGHDITLTGDTCIHSAFLYNRQGSLNLNTEGNVSCTSTGNSNILGVVWAQAINGGASPNHSGIVVPTDTSSLTDLLNNIDLPSNSQFGQIMRWSKVTL